MKPSFSSPNNHKSVKHLREECLRGKPLHAIPASDVRLARDEMLWAIGDEQQSHEHAE